MRPIKWIRLITRTPPLCPEPVKCQTHYGTGTEITARVRQTPGRARAFPPRGVVVQICESPPVACCYINQQRAPQRDSIPFLYGVSLNGTRKSLVALHFTRASSYPRGTCRCSEGSNTFVKLPAFIWIARGVRSIDCAAVFNTSRRFRNRHFRTAARRNGKLPPGDCGYKVETADFLLVEVRWMGRFQQPDTIRINFLSTTFMKFSDLSELPLVGAAATTPELAIKRKRGSPFVVHRQFHA